MSSEEKSWKVNIWQRADEKYEKRMKEELAKESQ